MTTYCAVKNTITDETGKQFLVLLPVSTSKTFAARAAVLLAEALNKQLAEIEGKQP